MDKLGLLGFWVIINISLNDEDDKEEKMDIKVLGTGCKKCKALYNLMNEVITDLGIQANIEKEEEIAKIVQYGVMLTPALVINGKVKMSGKVPSKADAQKYIQEEM